MNIIGVLDEVASAYGDNIVVESARNIGSGNQIKYLSSICTSSSCNVENGGVTTTGNDSSLIRNNFGTLIATDNNGNVRQYYNSSRFISTNSVSYNYFGTYYVDSTGNGAVNYLYHYYYDGTSYSYNASLGVRPILTIKSDAIIISGKGTIDEPYILSMNE